MPVLTTKDLAARTGSDPIIALVDDVITFAPEMGFYPVLPKKGLSYQVTRRTALPKAAFAPIGGGVTPSKSTYVQETKNLFWMDVQLEVPESITKGQDKTLGDILTDESGGAMQSAFFHLAQQLYYGTGNDTYGFQGYVSLISGDDNYEINVGGESGASTSAYLVALHEKGASIAAGDGNESGMTMTPWIKQQVTQTGTGTNLTTNPVKKLMAYVSNFSGYFGLTVASEYSVWRVRNIDATHPLTDKVAAQLVSQIPVQFRKNLRWFMNEVGQFTLQNARSSVGYQPAGSTGNPGFAPAPTELASYPITVSSAIENTEQ